MPPFEAAYSLSHIKKFICFIKVKKIIFLSLLKNSNKQIFRYLTQPAPHCILQQLPLLSETQN